MKPAAAKLTHQPETGIVKLYDLTLGRLADCESCYIWSPAHAISHHGLGYLSEFSPPADAEIREILATLAECIKSGMVPNDWRSQGA